MVEWKLVRLSELGEIVGGATPSTSREEYYQGNIPWLTPKDLAGYSGRYIGRGARSITKAGLESCSVRMLPPNTVLFSSRAPIGYVAIAQNELCTNQGFKSVVPNENVDPLFLYYLLKYNKNKIEALGSGTIFKEVSGATMKSIEVFVPTDVNVQKRIAAILSALDDKIELNNKINVNLERQGAEFVKQYRSVTDVGVPLSDIMSFDNGFPFQSGTYLSSGRYRVITIKNVQDGYIDSKGAAFIDKVPLKMKPNCVLHVGDVLLSLTGNVGRVGIVCESGLLLNQRVAKIVPKKQELLPFLYFFYRQSDMKILLESIAKGTAQLNLSPVETLNLTVPYKEESAILLSRLLSRLFQKVVANTQENLTLSTLRDALLPRLMSGQIEL